MELNNKLALIVSYYLSKYDIQALERLGYKNWRNAFSDISNILSVKANTIKNMRDEIDAIHPNNRVGWYQREFRPSRKEVIEKYKGKSEKELFEIVKKILDKKCRIIDEELRKNIDIKEIENEKIILKNVTAKTIANYNEGVKKDDTEQLFDLSEGINERLKRRKEHEELVKELAHYLENKNYKLYEGQIDCLAIKNDVALIFEIKTLNGEATDERSQVLKALAQLKYYKKFAMGQFSQLEKVYSLIVFSSKISDKYIEFLEENIIYTLYKENENINIDIINKIIETSI